MDEEIKKKLKKKFDELADVDFNSDIPVSEKKVKEGYTIPMEKNYPEAEVVLWEKTSGRERLWEVERCPCCGREHLYGAGNHGDDSRSYLGHQQSLCKSQYSTERFRFLMTLSPGLL